MALHIQQATINDIKTIRELTFKSWPQTYASILTQPQIEYMLEMMYSETELTKQIQQENHSFIIAQENSKSLGFASFSEIAQGIWKLHKIYILPESQGHGIGRFIINYIIKQIIPRGATALQLNVNRQNPAKSFYEKMDFKIIREEDIPIGNGYFMNDFIMEKQLKA
ncbi:MAG TPA: GNAT family N-acetyltransferase [Chitinophagaceae bacterium]